MSEVEKCGLCGRELGTVNVDEHHLLPKGLGGKTTDQNLVRLHRICHNAIHSRISTRELLTYYYTIERILEREDIKTFILWVQKKPID